MEASAFLSGLLAHASSPAGLFFLIILGTLILEDAATISAAVLAFSGQIHPAFALLALFIGIFTGDMMLYGAGSFAGKKGWVSRLISERFEGKARKLLAPRMISAILAARFLPGARLPTYLAMGYLQLSFRTFLAVIAAAGILWTSLLFGLIFTFGTFIFEALGPWRWVVTISMAALILIVPYIWQLLDKRPLSDRLEP